MLLMIEIPDGLLNKLSEDIDAVVERARPTQHLSSEQVRYADQFARVRNLAIELNKRIGEALEASESGNWKTVEALTRKCTLCGHDVIIDVTILKVRHLDRNLDLDHKARLEGFVCDPQALKVAARIPTVEELKIEPGTACSQLSSDA